MAIVLSRAPVVVTRPRVEAADQRNDSLFAARAALRRAHAVQHAAEAQVEQLRRLVERLEAERQRRD